MSRIEQSNIEQAAQQEDAAMNALAQELASDDDWELPGVACTLRPGMPGYDDCDACQ